MNRIPCRAVMPALLAAVALAGGLACGGRETTAMTDQPTTNAGADAAPADTPETAAPSAGGGREKAVFAAGCFWGVEAAFRKVPGVTATRVGYTGGHKDNPTYREVCNKGTGHAEAVEVTYDPEKVSYEDLLEVFWSCHDPTTLDRQGPDIGDQYRSAIFYLDERQKAAAEASKAAGDESNRFARPIVTEITPASTFWEAEEYHQQYHEKAGRASCHPGLK